MLKSLDPTDVLSRISPLVARRGEEEEKAEMKTTSFQKVASLLHLLYFAAMFDSYP